MSINILYKLPYNVVHITHAFRYYLVEIYHINNGDLSKRVFDKWTNTCEVESGRKEIYVPQMLKVSHERNKCLLN